ncbi:MAG TPA: ATP-dependent helicase [Thermodesulfobacteriota bacterium]|nr:ATP-dependent helicase [Thermodesulfobacteriota bacterium]
MRRYTLRPPAAAARRYEEELNEEQRAVVLAGGGPILVIAGAGSGKTRVVTYRVAYLLETGVPPGAILLATFTNKAAREMLRRVEAVTGRPTAGLWGGTFHHLGNRVLRRHARLIGYDPAFTILDRADAAELLDACAADLGYKGRGLRFPSGEVIGDLLSAAANTGRPLEAVLVERAPHLVPLADALRAVAARYQARKQAMGAMDFDDLLLRWLQLLLEHPRILERYQAHFRHILVDEYQDTNRLQGELVDRLAAGHRNLTVVGDDAQSIYAFRGAHFANIIEFPARYPDARLYRLETNYRSTPEILALANAAIARNVRQFDKRLRAVRPAGPRPAVVPLRDEGAQAAFVAQRLLELHDEGRPFAALAVLYRAHYQSLELQLELTRRGIPFEVRSGLRFFEQAHVKDATAYLRVTVNPRDELAWRRLFRLWPRIGAATADKLWSALAQTRDPLAVAVRGDLAPLVPRAAQAGFAACLATLRAVADPARRDKPAEQLRAVLETGYEAYLLARYPDAASRLEDLQQLARFALAYDSTEAFLAELALLGGVAGEEVVGAPGGGEEGEGRVVLSTIHQAKGLEWDAVFLIWVAEGKLPSARSAADPEGLEEERRLFYVAITRARDELYLCYPLVAREWASLASIQRPSRFLDELPPDTYEVWEVGEAEAGG